jgi:hypothetical protein
LYILNADWVYSQPVICGFDDVTQNMMEKNPNYLQSIKEYEDIYLQKQLEGGIVSPADIYYIPTVIHIIHNGGTENISDEQIFNALYETNSQLSGSEGGWDTKIQLVLASRDPFGNCITGINRVQTPNPVIDAGDPTLEAQIKNLSKLPNEKYLNIWVVQNILKNGIQSGSVGYSYLPSAQQIIPGDGIVIRHDYFGNTGTAYNPFYSSDVLSHELGHYLSLYHVWGTGNAPIPSDCHVNSLCLQAGDRVCDTAPCFNTGFCGDNSCSTDVPDEQDPMDNYMSYGYACHDKFTEGQTVRMHTCLTTIRNYLWSPENLNCTGGPYTIPQSPVLFGSIDLIVPSYTMSTMGTNFGNPPDVYMRGNIIIESGATLTINPEVVVHFCKDAKVIIKPGGKLNLKGKLTSNCSTGWKGVEVWGNSSTSQSSTSTKGILNCTTGSTIENAEVGVQLWGPNKQTNSGGIISCIGTKFINNRRSVEFAPYVALNSSGVPQNYQGYLSGCSFEANDSYLLPSSFESFIYMIGVNGVRINSCSFINKQTLVQNNIVGYGYGIYAIDAGFQLGSLNTSGVSSNANEISTFENLGYGVYASNNLFSKPFSVINSKFEGCYYGIYNSGISLSIVLFNEFMLGPIPNSTIETTQFGVYYTSGISGITCEENKFIGILKKNTPNISKTVGIYCNDLGPSNKNILRRNTLSNLNFGNVANKVNSFYGVDPIRGLHYLCNFNSLNKEADFAVNAGTYIRKDQGVEKPTTPITYKPAGNHFSHTLGGFDILYNTTFGDLNYHYPTQSLVEKPITFAGLVNLKDNPIEVSSCEPNYCVPKCKTKSELISLEADYYIQKSLFNIAKTAYNNSLGSANEAISKEHGREMSASLYQMDDDAHIIASHQIYDTLEFNIDSFRVWLRNMNNPAAQLLLSKTYLQSGNLTLAQNILFEMNLNRQSWRLSTEQANDYLELATLFGIIGNQSIYSLDSQILSVIEPFTRSINSETAAFAKSTLSIYGAYYPTEYTLPQIGEERRSDDDKGIDTTILKLKVYPNPSNSYVNFEINESDISNYGSITVNDINGKIIWTKPLQPGEIRSTWYVNDIPNGIYFYSVLINGDSPLIGKIAILK